MDAGAFVQENKRWLLGCAIGGVVWLVASSVLNSMHAVSAPRLSALGAPSEAYDHATKTAADEEHQQLAAQREALQRELAFVPSAKYQPQGNSGDALFRLGRELKATIAKAANSREVQFAESNVVWDPAGGAADVRATLFGLELIDELQQRLFAAHDATRATDENALGLRAILSLRLDARRNQRAPTRTTRPGEIDVRDFLTQESVQFSFLADEPTLQTFVESCRQPNRTLVIDQWSVQTPARPGEACAVKGVLLGILFKEAPPATAALDAVPDARAVATRSK